MAHTPTRLYSCTLLNDVWNRAATGPNKSIDLCTKAPPGS
jgi:hypothetical protein